MAHISATSAGLAYDKAIGKLKKACTRLEHHLPPASDIEGEDLLIPPPERPITAADHVVPCPLCTAELDELDQDARDAHSCTHNQQGVRREDDAGSVRSDGA